MEDLKESGEDPMSINIHLLTKHSVLSSKQGKIFSMSIASYHLFFTAQMSSFVSLYHWNEDPVKR